MSKVSSGVRTLEQIKETGVAWCTEKEFEFVFNRIKVLEDTFKQLEEELQIARLPDFRSNPHPF